MAGITQIRIPLKIDEATIENIVPYLPKIYKQFTTNKNAIRSDYDIYLLNHDILDKTRPHDEEINNIILSPHIKAMVDWKNGYTLGNPIKYAQSKSTQTNDITILNTYIRNSKKRNIDKEVGKWVYGTGIGYYFIQPKTTSFNISYEAPFELYAIDSDTCGKVYSSYLGHKPLFDFLYTTYEKIDVNNISKSYNIISIYLPEAMYVFETATGDNFELINTQLRGLYKMLPLVEKRSNDDGIGIVAMAKYLQNAIDRLSSTTLDNIEDIVNEVWLFFNLSLGKTNEEKKENFRAMKELGAGEINSTNPEFPADVKTMSTKLTLDEVMEVRQLLLREMYDCIGVPIASNNVASGNITKGGGEVANGYENAYNRALDDINGFIKADNELLERIIYICQNTPDCKLDELQASEIEIKYCLNMTDNMLTKSQSYVNFITNGMPPAMALEKTKISNDPEAEGAMIEAYMTKKSEEMQKVQNKGINEV